jgi:hypothetical protein
VPYIEREVKGRDGRPIPPGTRCAAADARLVFKMRRLSFADVERKLRGIRAEITAPTDDSFAIHVRPRDVAEDALETTIVNILRRLAGT